MTMAFGGYISRLLHGCRRFAGVGIDSSRWGCIPFPDGGDWSAETDALRRCGVAPERIDVGGDFRRVLSRCREDDTLLVYLPEAAAEHRDLLCELLWEASRRKVNFRAVGAYEFEIGADDRLLCDYVLLHTLLDTLYARVSRREAAGKRGHEK